MTDSFFKGKRPWSKIKDQILGSYMVPYLSKVAKLKKTIILIDAFAGPGKFDDGSAGSPLIICRIAERKVSGKYLAIFVNKNKTAHKRLCAVLQSSIAEANVLPILGSAEDLLTQIHPLLEDQTVFLYLDPFGLTGCEFSLLEPFIKREKRFSTEIVINLSVPFIHRLATRKAIEAGREDEPQIKRMNNKLSLVLGGDYWKEIMWGAELDHKTRIDSVVSTYLTKIQDLGLEYTGACPVREKPGAGIKYYIAFGSRHPDAMLLMNDIMCTAYNEKMHEVSTERTFFEFTDWRDERDLKPLSQIVLGVIKKNPKISRNQLWLEIVQGHFMKYLKRELRRVVGTLHGEGVVDFVDVKGTRQINDQSLLFLKR